MASGFFVKPNSFSLGSLAAEENEVADDSSSEIDESASMPPSLDVARSKFNDKPSFAEDDFLVGISDVSTVGKTEDFSDVSSRNDANSQPNTIPPKWSDTLSTPSDCAAFTPASDMSSLKENLHGLALTHSVNRAKVLARTGKSCASLISDIAGLHDDLSQAILKLCPSALEAAADGTPMEEFAQHVNSCIISYAKQMQRLGVRLREDVARPWIDFNASLGEKAPKLYSEYVASRAKCAQARKEALKMRQKYVGVVQDAETAIQALRRARATNPARKSTQRSDTSSSVLSEEKKDEDVQWEKALKEFGKRHGLTKQCDSVIRGLEEIQTAEAQYCALVEIENGAVENAQDVERTGLDAMQSNEEERVIFVLLSLDRCIQIGKEAFADMSLDLSATPLNLDDGNHKELRIPSSSSSSIFMTPRRRTQSEDGPAINETRMLNLPDHVAVLRDNIKSHIGRQSARLKTLKSISSFNESLASAFDTFASGLHAKLESEGYSGKSDGKNSSAVAVVLNKTEGENVINLWNRLIKSLSDYATSASHLSNQIKSGNSELYNILLSADRELKSLYENEETRWKNLCDAAKGETKAKMKQKQYMTDLQKAQMRLSIDEDGSNDNADDPPQDDAKNPKANFMGQSMKMSTSMNKAMGKMFSVLPGGGEEVMNKVLKPEQRRGILEKNLDEAKRKEAKASESFGIASGVKNVSIATYQSEAECTLHKVKTNERYVWAQMQKSLENSVIAIKTFRDSQHCEIAMSDSGDTTDIHKAAWSDLSQWTADIESRVKDYRARYSADRKDEGSSYETGFSLQLILEESSDIKELVNLVVNDNDEFEVPMDNIGSEKSVAPLPDVPEDPVIKDMDLIFSKKLKNVSIESYYQIGWSEETTPLYGPWLEKKGSFDISVSEWEHSKEGFKHNWSGETFPQRRVIRFKFKRTTHLYIGPPIAGVTQTQYCVLDGSNRCITMMTVEMDGIPYSDAFAVEVRWSARRQGEKDIIIDAGVHVRFLKSSMFAKQIRSGTLTETKPIHLDLFEVIKLAITSEESIDVGVEVELEEESGIDSKAAIVEGEALKEPVGLPPFKKYIKLLSDTFWSLRNEQRVLSGVIFFGALWMLTHRPTKDERSIGDLVWRVDQLSSDLNDIKALLNTIVQLMNESNQLLPKDEP